MVDANKLIPMLPKAELHIHIEGTLEPELMLKLAHKNKVRLPFDSVMDIKKAYNFKNLEDFLNVYYYGMGVLKTQEDFYELTENYLLKAVENNVRHVEISFDPQAHISRGLKFETVVDGIYSALRDGEKKYGISWKIILSILRDHPIKSAMKTLELAEAYLDIIEVIGLDSAEIGNPPSKFKEVFMKAHKLGLLKTVHAGEEGPPSYIKEAVEELNVDRIDHGIRVVEDPHLLNELGYRKMTFTLCPLSNLKLHVFKDLEHYPVRELMNAGIVVTINSDDPAYFRGYLNENYLKLVNALHLTVEEIIILVRNSIIGSFADEYIKKNLLRELEKIIKSNKLKAI